MVSSLNHYIPHLWNAGQVMTAHGRRHGISVIEAMAAGLVDKVLKMADVASMIDDAAMRTTIQKRVAALALPQSN